MVSLSLSLKTPWPRAVQVSTDAASTEHTSNQSKSQRREFGMAEEHCGTQESVTVFFTYNLFGRILVINITRSKVQLYMESHCSGCKAPNFWRVFSLNPNSHMPLSLGPSGVNLVISHSSGSRESDPITKQQSRTGLFVLT